MPIRDFICNNCDQPKIEKIVKSDVKTIPCPTCGSDMETTISAPARAQFKGTGWYESDFKHKR
ncbi:MAG: FmdB family transcriptional regulator [Idiomarinaceae bacterium]|nr:FmdB family transcriptional regulator [Idiomarinaceae bacterium]